MKCACCGNEFTPKTKNHRFCCRRCSQKGNYRENPERRRKNREYSAARRQDKVKPPATKICVICGKEFQTRHNRQKCCSAECSLANKHRHSKDYYYNQFSAKLVSEPKPVIGEEKYFCRNCGKEFKPTPSLTLFCNRQCYDEYRRKPKNKPAPKTQGKPIEEWINEAKECNLDYGTYRGLIEQGKTFDQLKALAPTRNTQVHQRTPHRERGNI